MSVWRVGFVITVTLLSLAASASAIIRRHDRDDARYLELGSKFTAVTQIGGGTGTLIGDRWLITAAHVTANLSPFDTTVGFNGKSYRIKGISSHPRSQPQAGPDSFDIALVELADAVEGVEPVAVYEKENENGQQVVFVGPGMYGDGQAGPTGEDGKYRGATNTVTDVMDMHIRFQFDAPPGGTDLEGISGPGDSGGPALIESDGRTYIVGISSANDDGEAGGPCRYNSTEYYARVSTASGWIRATMKSGAEPLARKSRIHDLKAGHWPDSRAGQVAAAFFEAYNRGDDESMANFERQFRAEAALRDRPVEQRAQAWRQYRQDWQALKPRKAVAAPGNKLYVLVYAEGEKVWKTFGFQFEADLPMKLAGIGIASPATPPAD